MADRTTDSVRRSIRLRDGVSLVDSADGDSALMMPSHLQDIGRLTAAQKDFLRSLTSEQVMPTDDSEISAVARILVAGGWVVTRVELAGVPMFTAHPRRSRLLPSPPQQPLRLSRFAAIRRDGTDHLVESASAASVLTLHVPDLIQVVADSQADSALPAAVVDLLRSQLRSDGFLTTRSEDDDLTLAQWAPHEMAFHHSSRQRADHRVGVDFGGTHWARGIFEQPPPRHPRWSGEVIALPSVSVDSMGTAEPTLSEALRTRRSVRTYDEEHPVTVEQLGLLLHGAARVQSADPHEGMLPYPGGGGVHELELYPLVRHVDGLAAGLYHYDPSEHGLRPVPTRSVPARELLAASARAMTGPATPQVLLIVTSRFGRLAWKYESIAYALTLKQVGALFQTLYLVAGGLGLAPCALGVGDSDAFAEATGLDYFAEPSVGEFALGSLPAAQGAR